MNEKQRLSKVMAQAGIASRRHCEDIIFDGRVTVNGEKTVLPQTMVSNDDEIFLDGKPLSGVEPKAYYILNKPIGCVCANVDEYYKTVKELFENVNLRLFSVGRLDKNTSGLLIMTNDGHFAQKVIHPSSNIEKEYVAHTHRPITKKDLEIIANGVEVEGTFIIPKLVKQMDKNKIRVVVMEGKKREVRYLLNNASLNVLELHRTRIGDLTLEKSLKEGQWRVMTEQEKQRIFA